jgi:hypothetical protein
MRVGFLGDIKMPSSYLTELALRAAVSSAKRTLTGESDQVTKIKEVALKRSQELVQGQSSESSLRTEMDAQSIAINVAIKGLELAYKAIARQIEVLNDKRLSFDKERQAGIATFMIPTDKEESSLTHEERIINNFNTLIAGSPSFSKYLGIHNAELTTITDNKFYSVLPFYRMSEALGQPVASTKPLDCQRVAISLFFKSALPDAISDIEMGFQTDTGFISFWESAYQRRNYLNNRRAPRFIMMSLSNLLWNLQHPVDHETGFPLSSRQCIELCRDVELFLNRLLDPASPNYLKPISNSENGLISFVRKLEVHTKGLKAAYEEEQLHELNIDDVTNSAHNALRVINKSVLKLIYKRNNPITKKDEPDDQAAENIAYMISFLNQLLIRNPDLMDVFRVFPTWIPPAAGMNIPPLTVVDALIIFSHLSWRQRDQLIATLKKSNIASALEFAQTLKNFDEKFISPIKEVSKKELHASVFNPKHEEVSRLTARRLIPLVTLVIKDFQIEVDSELTSQRAKRSQSNPTAKIIWSGKQQVQSINASANKGDEYYYWSLSPFVRMSAEVAAEIEDLPKRQYRITQMTELLDNVSDLVQHYRSFLQNKLFQSFLLKCLSRVKEEYAALDAHINKVDLHLAHDERMTRSLQSILRPMTRDINNSLEGFALATANFERLVSSPDFTEQQRQILATKLTSVSDQFSKLFGEETGITDLVDTSPIPRSIPSTSISSLPSPEMVEARKVIALRKLVQRCYMALSIQSRDGHKGVLLRELLTIIEEKPSFTDKQIKHVIMELIRVTASYRETWLFQAAYGQTRSARALIAAIKDPSLNTILPFSSLIFEQANLDMGDFSDAHILKRLKGMREGNHWQEASSQLQLITISN